MDASIMTELQQDAPVLVPVEQLQDHPQNPRLVMREDVICAIVAGIGDGFDPAHALIVRPVDGGYQVLSGHHRKAAAQRVGLAQVPCWVRDMGDDEAYMTLATSNSQGELSPLEVGMHALHFVEKGKHGAGLVDYAEQLGKGKTVVADYRRAAEVLSKIPDVRNFDPFLSKAAHLAEISKLPDFAWPEAVQLMLDGEWSAKETRERVKEAKDAGTGKQMLALLAGKTSWRELERIGDLGLRVEQSLTFDDLIQAWRNWFADADPIDIKEVQSKRVEFEQKEYERKQAESEDATDLPGLVLADPPWRYDFAQSDSRQIENQYPSATVDDIIAHRPETAPDCVLLLWATVAKLPQAFEVMQGWGFEYKTSAVWDKEKIGMGYWFRGQHELLLVGTKGKASPPDPEHRVSSVFREPRGKHSAKPECVYQWIESAFHGAVKLEMYSRDARAGWRVFGNEC